MKKIAYAPLTLILFLASCGSLSDSPNAVNPNKSLGSQFVITETTDAQLEQLALQHPELKSDIESFIANSKDALQNIEQNSLSPQSIIVGGASSCTGEVDMYDLGGNVKATMNTFCSGTGTRKVVASQARLRLENITSNTIVYDNGNNSAGNNYLVQYLPNPSGGQLFCSKGWLFLTYADGTKGQGQTGDNYCGVY